MRTLIVLLAATGCGRIAFDDATGATGDGGADALGGTDATLANHDEDGDGLDDAIDPCPHLGDATTDQDSDGIGDLCDPNPTTSGEGIALFATMRAGDAPFTTGGGWVQESDALATDGTAYAYIDYLGALGNARLIAGVDVLASVGGGFHQIALGGDDASQVGYFTEVQDTAGAGVAQLSSNDNGTLGTVQQGVLASGVHPGDLRLQITHRGTSAVDGEAGWPGEVYQLQGPAPLYNGMVSFRLGQNNVAIRVRYILVITSP